MRRSSLSHFILLPVLALALQACPRPVLQFKLDHFLAYTVERQELEEPVRLADQLDPEAKRAVVVGVIAFANPVTKQRGREVTEIRDRNAHLTFYAIKQEAPEPRRTVRLENQFGQQSIDIRDPRYLLTPTEKTSDRDSAFPKELDHFKCYQVVRVNSFNPPNVDLLKDQFGDRDVGQLGSPQLFCIPVKKERRGEDPREIMNERDHLTFYKISPEDKPMEIETLDQFGDRKMSIERSFLLGVPTEKEVVVPHQD